MPYGSGVVLTRLYSLLVLLACQMRLEDGPFREAFLACRAPDALA